MRENKIMNEKEAAQYIGLSLSYLQHDRCYGELEKRKPGPAYLKLGRSVRYLQKDLDAWLEKSRVQY